MKPKQVCFILLLIIGLTGCELSPGRTAYPTIASETLTPPPIATAISTLVPTETSTDIPIPTATEEPISLPSPDPTPDLSSRLLVWFSPMPPLKILPSRPYTGSDDFMQLFTPGAAWQQASSHVNVFKLYGEWVEDVPWSIHATDAELTQVLTDLQRRGIAIGVEVGPLNPGPNCGQGIEGFATVQAGLNITQRIKNLGGTLSFISFDEPFAFASLYDGQNACHWTAEKVAQEVQKFIRSVSVVFPDVIFGDTEPLWTGVDVDALKSWIDAYESVMGHPLAFLHLDQDFSRPNWEQDTLELETYARQHGVEFGVIYLGDGRATSDEDWISSAGEHILQYEDKFGGQPDHILFQSWYDHPDRVLPEMEPFTFTWLINAYFDDRSALGYRTEGEGANLAIGKSVRVSSLIPGNEAEKAIDRNSETWWGSGAFPPQWIEIDLGKSYSIAEINLFTSQYPDGHTTHNVYVRGPEIEDAYVLLHTFSGITTDLEWLRVPLADPIDDIRYIYIETTESPSWVSWREIEVIAAK